MLPGEEERDKQSDDLIIGVDRTVLVLHVHEHLNQDQGSDLTEITRQCEGVDSQQSSTPRQQLGDLCSHLIFNIH